MSSYYPSWHFIGSKLSMLPFITEHLKELPFHTALDLFGGTGIVCHELRLNKKIVFYNDFLKSLQITAHGLLNASNEDVITNDEVNKILSDGEIYNLNELMSETLKNYYFNDEVQIILNIYDRIQNSKLNIIQHELMLFALFQVMLVKRPFHTFHGSFLKMRMKERTEKQTWDKDIGAIFQECINEVNDFLAHLPYDLPPVKTSSFKASEAKPEFFTDQQIDLLYLDPPFISDQKKRTLKFANYTKNYHILELLIQKDDINSFKDPETKELVMGKFLPLEEMNLWLDQNQKNWLKSIEKIIKNFEDSKVVISYRSDSLIVKEQIIDILNSYKEVSFYQTLHKYEKKGKESKFSDYLFIGT